MVDVDRLLVEAVAAVEQPTNAQEEIINRIKKLRARLAEGVLRVAVLGQFKRGKSTLLNALLEMPLLPTGITPITSIPTFIKYGAASLARISFKDGKEPILVSAPSDINEALGQYVSEIKNPHNRFNVGSVEVQVQSAFLSQGIILIDTPGIGSTFTHNTEAAEAVLPECDAALFLISADPPLTDAEASYLQKIWQFIPKIVFALNKVDLLTKEEMTCAEEFLLDQLKARLPNFKDGKIFSISARAGVDAKLRQDNVAFEASGIPRLQNVLAAELAQEKQAIFYETALRRSISLVGELLFQSGIEKNALLLPEEVLEEKRKRFESAVLHFESQRQQLSDLLAVDQKQIFKELESETDRLWHEAQAEMQRIMREFSSEPLEVTRKRISDALYVRFEDSFRRGVGVFNQKIGEKLSIHQGKAATLVQSIRQMAADLMEIPLVEVLPEEVIEVKQEPYWVAPETPPSLTAISTSALTRLLPTAMRARRQRKQLADDIEAAVLRNIANLDWAIRQNTNDAFRRFEFFFNQQLASALAATREAIHMAVQLRRDQAYACQARVQAATRAVRDLSRVQKTLRI